MVLQQEAEGEAGLSELAGKRAPGDERQPRGSPRQPPLHPRTTSHPTIPVSIGRSSDKLDVVYSVSFSQHVITGFSFLTKDKTKEQTFQNWCTQTQTREFLPFKRRNPLIPSSYLSGHEIFPNVICFYLSAVNRRISDSYVSTKVVQNWHCTTDGKSYRLLSIKDYRKQSKRS